MVPKRSLAVLCMVMVAGGALILACSGDGAPTPGGSSGTSSSGTSGTPSSGTSGTSGTPATPGTSNEDAGGTGDAGNDGGGGTKANGATCTAPGAAGDAECQSGHCIKQGNGGNAKIICSIACDNMGDDDPKCVAAGAPLTGRCSGQGFCQVN